MDLQAMRLLMDINALQSFGTVQNLSSQNESNSTLFSSMLGDFLTQTTENQMTDNNPLLYHGGNDVFLPNSLQTLQAKYNEIAVNHSTQTRPKQQHTNDYASIIKKAAEQFQLPERLISSVIKHESNFNNDVVSRAGAAGLMQLMPGTAKFLGVKDRFDPEQNIMGGARYLRQMLNQFDGDTKTALAAYNAGPGNVKKYGGVPPFKETQNYVTKVLNTLNG